MDADAFRSTYGPWALVVGAGAGLGASYATQLAAAGLSLVLVDRDGDALDALQRTLDTETEAVTVDLAAPDALDRILDVAGPRDVGLVVANAAASHVGDFVEQSAASVEAQIMVNVLGPTALVQRMVPSLLARDRAGVILMSSQSSRRGAPLVATYAATKAYLGILAEGLWDELGPHGIDVLAVLPGSTRTPGWLSSLPQAGVGTNSLMDPDDVVREALDTLGTGVPSIVSGETNRSAETFLESLDRADAVRAVGQVMRDMYPRERAVDERV